MNAQKSPVSVRWPSALPKGVTGAAMALEVSAIFALVVGVGSGGLADDTASTLRG